jgi:hypothetical protein
VILMFSIFFHIFLYTNPTTAMARLSVFSIKEKNCNLRHGRLASQDSKIDQGK